MSLASFFKVFKMSGERMSIYTFLLMML